MKRDGSLYAPVSACLCGGHPRVTRLLGSLVFADFQRRTSRGRETECSVDNLDRPATTGGNEIDEVISHLHRAGLLVHARFRLADPALVDPLWDVTDELDAAISGLQRAALYGRFHPSGSPASSGQEARP